jgi:hypothetical protein
MSLADCHTGFTQEVEICRWYVSTSEEKEAFSRVPEP